MAPEPSPSSRLNPCQHQRSVGRSGAGELAGAFLGRGQGIVYLDHARERAAQAFYA